MSIESANEQITGIARLLNGNLPPDDVNPRIDEAFQTINSFGFTVYGEMPYKKDHFRWHQEHPLKHWALLSELHNPSVTESIFLPSPYKKEEAKHIVRAAGLIIQNDLEVVRYIVPVLDAVYDVRLTREDLRKTGGIVLSITP